MIGCQRIPLTEVRDVFIFRIYLRQYIMHFLISTSSLCTLHVYISHHCFWMVYCLYWVFVCICCAAPDKLTSPPPFTGLGALQRPSRGSTGDALSDAARPWDVKTRQQRTFCLKESVLHLRRKRHEKT